MEGKHGNVYNNPNGKNLTKVSSYLNNVQSTHDDILIPIQFSIKDICSYWDKKKTVNSAT